MTLKPNTYPDQADVIAQLEKANAEIETLKVQLASRATVPTPVSVSKPVAATPAAPAPGRKLTLTDQILAAKGVANLIELRAKIASQTPAKE